MVSPRDEPHGSGAYRPRQPSSAPSIPHPPRLHKVSQERSVSKYVDWSNSLRTDTDA
jgi:hypothetical protein